MNKMKFTREDMQTTFMDVAVEISELSCWANRSDGCGCFAKIEVTLNGTLIWVVHTEYLRECFDNLWLIDPRVGEVNPRGDYVGMVLPFESYDFDPEVADLVCELMVKHEVSTFSNIIDQVEKYVAARHL